MTIAKQLLLMLLLMLSILFSGTFFINMHSTHKFLEEQLANHAHDTATSLGLSLSKLANLDDKVQLSRMVDAIFDSGYYQYINLEDFSGKLMLPPRSNPKHDSKVPQWFINLIPLNIPEKHALIMHGWQQIGQVKVLSNPSVAYSKLWEETLESLLWFSLAALVTLSITLIMLRVILRPLHAICSQAEQICNQKFYVQDTLPLTTDLRSVVKVMNKMSLRLKSIFEEQVVKMEEIREQSYLDQVTNLGNRKSFNNQLKHILLRDSEVHSGALIILELNDFVEYNLAHGYDEGDNLLRDVADTLRGIMRRHPDLVVSKLQSGVFALIVPLLDMPVLKKLADQIITELSDLPTKGLSDASDVAHMGIAVFMTGEKSATVLGRANMALILARKQGANAWHIYQEEELKVYSESDWQGILDDVIVNDKIVIHFLPTVDSKWLQPIHYEACVKIPYMSKLLSADVFIPIAERLHVMSQLDRLIIEHIISLCEHSEQERVYSVNISVSALLDKNFVQWFYEQIDTYPRLRQQLHIELTEYAASRHVLEVGGFVTKMNSYHIGVGLDKFGKDSSPFVYLHSMHFDYLKIDGSFVRNINVNQNNQFYIRSISSVAKELDMSVYAESVATKEELQALTELGVTGIQGPIAGEACVFEHSYDEVAQ